MSNFKGWEIIIILALLLLLFGAKRLPDAARGLGRSMRIFKAETKGLRDDDDDRPRADRTADPDRAADDAPARAVAPRELPSARPVDEPRAAGPAEHPTSER
jgi:sec-independent protein translocase protein TatA